MSIESDALYFDPISVLRRLLGAKKISAVELTRVFLSRLEVLGPEYNALAELTTELALKQARRADQKLHRNQNTNALTGIPYGAKDLLATKGIPTPWGARPCATKFLTMMRQ
jgi:aspartyl-tRNA(Asn)/glutamyl-tRNA(Gln) amidotransferase subunit A